MADIAEVVEHIREIERLLRAVRTDRLDEAAVDDAQRLVLHFDLSRMEQDANARQERLVSSDQYRVLNMLQEPPNSAGSIGSSSAVTLGLLLELLGNVPPSFPMNTRAFLGLEVPSGSTSLGDLFRAYEVLLLVELGVPFSIATDAARHLARPADIFDVGSTYSNTLVLGLFNGPAALRQLDDWRQRISLLLTQASAHGNAALLRLALLHMRYRDLIELIFEADGHVAPANLRLASQALGQINSAFDLSKLQLQMEVLLRDT